ncbi:MAG: hypothetical protein AABZ01_05405, partial [Gemmatimonadota bacterium]
LLAGAAAAGALIWLLEGAFGLLYVDQMTAILADHGLGMAMSPSMIALTLVVSLLAGLSVVFFYALARPRLGPGPRTAVIVAIGLWVGGWLLALIGYRMIGLYPVRLLVMWGATGLLEMILAGVLGAWVYREA